MLTTISGDYIIIGIGKDNKGKIFFCYHDRPNNLLELADSFETFLNKCKS